MSRQPAALGEAQIKIPLLILPEEFGVNEQEVKDCLAGLKAHEELCQDRKDFPGWVKNRITDAMDAARAAGRAAREEREAEEADTKLAGQLEGVAGHYGLSVDALERSLHGLEAEEGTRPKKKK
jgi:hypothetical protein